MASTYTPIATTTTTGSAASITFSSITSIYTDLIVVVGGSSSGVNVDFGFRFNGDTGSNYSRTYLYGDGSSAASGRNSNTTQMSSFNIGQNQTTAIAHINNYASTSVYKTVLSRYSHTQLGPAAIVGLWRSTAAINQIELYSTSGGNYFTNGTVITLYGIKAA